MTVRQGADGAIRTLVGLVAVMLALFVITVLVESTNGLGAIVVVVTAVAAGVIAYEFTNEPVRRAQQGVESSSQLATRTIEALRRSDGPTLSLAYATLGQGAAVMRSGAMVAAAAFLLAGVVSFRLLSPSGSLPADVGPGVGPAPTVQESAIASPQPPSTVEPSEGLIAGRPLSELRILPLPPGPDPKPGAMDPPPPPVVERSAGPTIVEYSLSDPRSLGLDEVARLFRSSPVLIREATDLDPSPSSQLVPTPLDVLLIGDGARADYRVEPGLSLLDLAVSQQIPASLFQDGRYRGPPVFLAIR